MRVGVPKEAVPGERRVALVPETVGRLGAGVEVVVEPGAGSAAGFADEAYGDAGAALGDAWFADVVVKVASPTAAEVPRLRGGQVLVAFLAPLADPDGIERLARAGVHALALESIPRITRAQPMDALSSQATVAGYKAALLAADTLPRFLPMLMTAAGTIPPAKVLVLGAGVAGLQAIATARRLGGIVSSFDVRPAVREQVESLGATFLAVITTAAIPGRPAPKLVTAEAVRGMRAGSVIVDLAAETGGNCELTRPGEVVEQAGVTIVGTTNLPATMATHASQLLSRNMAALLGLLARDGKLVLDWDD